MRSFRASRASSRVRTLLAAAPVLAMALAAGSGVAPTTSPQPASPPAAGTPVSTGAPVAQPSVTRWRVTTSPHLDLWLHSFALISQDTALVPLYRRGYRDSVSAVRTRANILTALDGNRAALATGLAASPQYLQAQFLPFEFGSWEDMKLAAERFLQFEGEPRRAPDQNTAARVALFASIFPSPSDRNWLRLFISAVQDENTRWFATEHQRVAQERSVVVVSVESLWTRTYRSRFERFLNNTGQRNGYLVLSLPLGGEGRTGNGRERQTVVAVGWPGRMQDAREAILVFAHEITGALVGGVVTDNTTPAEKRDGVSDRYVAAGQTRAGAMLLQKIAPELVEPYMRYYLEQAGVRPAGSLSDAFSGRFELPKAITDGLLRQIEIVLGGI